MTTNPLNQEIRDREENRARNVLYKHLMSIPHDQPEEFLIEMQTAFEIDPDFISKMCVFLADGGAEMPNQVSIAIATLLTADNKKYQKAGEYLDEKARKARIKADLRKKEIMRRTSNKIEKNLLILVDRSESMENAIEVATQFCAKITPLCTADLMVIYHNDVGAIIDAEIRSEINSWTHAFRNVKAGGNVLHQRGLQTALIAGFEPEAIVMITNGDEDKNSNIIQTIVNYSNNTGVDVHVIMIGVDVGDKNTLGPRLGQSGLRFDDLVFDGDYSLFNQIGILLSGPPQQSIVERIMEIELPRRINI